MSKLIEIPIDEKQICESESLGSPVVKKDIKQVLTEIISGAESEDLTESCLKTMINLFVEYAGIEDLEMALKKLIPEYIDSVEDDSGVYTGALKLALKVVKAN